MSKYLNTPWRVIKEGSTFIVVDNFGLELFVSNNEISNDFFDEIKSYAILAAKAPNLFATLQNIANLTPVEPDHSRSDLADDLNMAIEMANKAVKLVSDSNIIDMGNSDETAAPEDNGINDDLFDALVRLLGACDDSDGFNPNHEGEEHESSELARSVLKKAIEAKLAADR